MCYSIFFLGFTMVVLELINIKFLPVFSLPFVFVSLFLLFYPSEHKYFRQKKFIFLESIQLLLISVKFSNANFITWSYVLTIFLILSVYLFILGMLMCIILACTTLGFVYRNLDPWKLKALIWMTFYYMSTGFCYTFLIRGIIQFYERNHEEKYFG